MRFPFALAVCIAMLLTASLAVASAFTGQSVVLEYSITQADAKQSVRQYLVEKRLRGFDIKMFQGRTTRTVTTDDTLETRVEDYLNPQTSSHLTIVRNADAVTISGTSGNVKVDHGFRLAGPWFSTPLQLQGFVLSGESSIEFCAVQPESGDLERGVLRREEFDTVQICGTSVRAVRFEYTASGFLGKSRKSHYWYRAKDGLLLQIREITGDRPHPAMQMLLVRESALPALPAVARLRGPMRNA